jgi:transcriptional antiterminator RfaH
MLDAAPATRLDAARHDSAGSLATPRMSCYSNSAPRWACVYTQPQAETWADANLCRAGYETYLPLYATRRRDRVVRSMFHNVMLPLFPRYLFVMFDHHTASWSPIRATPGVTDIIRCGLEPQYASAGAVEAVRAAEDVRRTLPAGQSTRWLPGAVVRVSRGILGGMPGVVLTVDDDTVQVSVMFLGQLRTIALPAGFLTARDEG